jgi:AraC-like DNA-binding protein
VRPADGIDAFMRAPEGTYVTGRNWLYYCADAGFYGQIYWGTPEPTDIEKLLAVWVVERRAGAASYVSLVDARQLQAATSDAFAMVASDVASGQKELGIKLQRQALVRPQGVIGAVVTGFYGTFEHAYPVEVFDDLDAALAWLGRPEMAPAVTQLAERAVAEDAMVRALRLHLAGALRQATLPSAARALAVSERTLQRRLREAGTTFQDELTAARVRAAEELLLDADRKLTAIAVEVGCATLQHFSALFRRATGVSPSAWRARRR